jgi:hypothetical protein
MGGFEKMKKFIKKLFDILAFCLGVRGTETEKKYTDLGLIDYRGQGREKTDSGEDAKK